MVYVNITSAKDFIYFMNQVDPDMSLSEILELYEVYKKENSKTQPMYFTTVKNLYRYLRAEADKKTLVNCISEPLVEKKPEIKEEKEEAKKEEPKILKKVVKAENISKAKAPRVSINSIKRYTEKDLNEAKKEEVKVEKEINLKVEDKAKEVSFLNTKDKLNPKVSILTLEDLKKDFKLGKMKSPKIKGFSIKANGALKKEWKDDISFTWAELFVEMMVHVTKIYSGSILNNPKFSVWINRKESELRSVTQMKAKDGFFVCTHSNTETKIKLLISLFNEINCDLKNVRIEMENY